MNDSAGRLDAIELRLSRLEEALGTQMPEAPAPAAVGGTEPAPADAAPAKGPNPFMVDEPSAPAPARTDAGEASAFGAGNWLALIAIVCFVLAGCFIIKLSVDAGWLTPVRQVLLAALSGLALIGTGLLLLARDRPYAAWLPGGGCIILFLSTYAAQRYHGLLSHEVGLVLAALCGAFCMGLYSRVRHDLFPVTAAIGTYAAPLIVDMPAGTSFTTNFTVLCSVVFATLAIRLQSRLTAMAGAYMAIVATAVTGYSLRDDLTIALALGAHLVIYSVGTYLHSRRSGRAMAPLETWALLPVLLMFYVCEYHYVERIQPEAAPWLSLLFAVLVTGLAFLARRSLGKNQEPMHSPAMTLTFAAVVFVHSVYFNLMPDWLRPWILPAGTLALVLAPPLAPGSTFRFPAAVIGLVLGWQYLGTVMELVTGSDTALSLQLAALLAVAALLSLRFRGTKLPWEDSDLHMLIMAHVLAIPTLYSLTEGRGSLAVSLSWLIYALLILGGGFVRRDRLMARSATAVLFIAAAKALLYDASSAPTIVRIICLLVTGGALYGCGFLLRRINGWEPGGEKPAAQG